MKLKDWIKVNDIKVTELEKATGIPHPTLLSYINEKHDISLKNALKIHKATLGAVSLEDMLIEKE